MRRVALVVGESVVDVVRHRDGTEQRHPGGSAANAAVALARLGRAVRLATAWADDADGRLLADHLRRNGVALAADPAVLERTATARATIGEDGAATYRFDVDWRLPRPDPSGPEPVAVLWGSLGAVLDPGAATVRDLVAALRHRTLTCYDLNARPEVTGAGAEVVARTEAMVALADVVKASVEDLAALWPDVGETAAVGRLLDGGARAVVVTRGASGASWCSPTLRVDVPATRTRVVDTIGAGDTLGAAVVDRLWDLGIVGPGASDGLAGISPTQAREVLEWAVTAAAVTVSRPGADPPTPAEIDAARWERDR